MGFLELYFITCAIDDRTNVDQIFLATDSFFFKNGEMIDRSGQDHVIRISFSVVFTELGASHLQKTEQ